MISVLPGCPECFCIQKRATFSSFVSIHGACAIYMVVVLLCDASAYSFTVIIYLLNTLLHGLQVFEQALITRSPRQSCKNDLDLGHRQMEDALLKGQFTGPID